MNPVSDTADSVHPHLDGSGGSCLVSAHNEPGAIVIEMVGTLAAGSVAEVNALIHHHVGRAAGRLVVLDLDGLTLVDETALSMTAYADVQARRAGTRLRLIATAGGLTRALRSAGVDRRIPLCDSYIDALTYREA